MSDGQSSNRPPPSSLPANRRGERNSGSRRSEHVGLQQALGVIRASRTAACIGLPLNRHLTIHWARAGLDDAQASDATTRFLTLARDWIRKQGGQISYLYIREGRSGSHVHILMHVPPALVGGFSGRQRGWIKRVVGAKYRRRTVKTRPIGKTTRAAWEEPRDYHANLAKIVAYLLKGVSKTVADELGLPLFRPQGRVVGKRVGWSENIGARASTLRVDHAPRD